MNKFERIKKAIDDHWGFDLVRCSPANRGWWAGCWKTGFAVYNTLRGSRWVRYRSLAQIERAKIDGIPLVPNKTGETT